MRRKLLAEFLGTFCLVFAGTGAIVANEISHGAVTHLGMSLTFGLVVMAMIYAFGDVSGAHLNPAVSVGFLLARRFRARDAAAYALAQTLGAVAASAALRAIFPNCQTLGATVPAGDPLQSLALEAILSMMLMLVILAVSTGPKEKGIMAGIAIGGVVAFEALLGGPISGASMNPARTLGPAVVLSQWSHAWIYIVAPIGGAAIAVGLHAALARPSGTMAIDSSNDARPER